MAKLTAKNPLLGILTMVALMLIVTMTIQPLLINRIVNAQLLNDRDNDGIEDELDPCPDDPDTACTTPDSEAILPGINAPIDQGQEQAVDEAVCVAEEQVCVAEEQVTGATNETTPERDEAPPVGTEVPEIVFCIPNRETCNQTDVLINEAGDLICDPKERDCSQFISQQTPTQPAGQQETGVSGGSSGTASCEGNLAQELPGARKTLDDAAANAKDFIGLSAGGGEIKEYPNSNLYWFAKLYDYTTFLEIQKLKSLEHPAMVAHFIPIFFGLYKQAVDSYQNHDFSNVPAHWSLHFKTSQEEDIDLSGVRKSIETGAIAHIQGDIAKAFVLAYKSFVNKYCPGNPPPLEYFRGDFFSPVALKIFPESQSSMFTEIARIMRPMGPGGLSIEKMQLALGIGSKYFGISLDTVYKWREDAWVQAKRELKQ